MTFNPEELALLYFRRRDGSAYITRVTIVRRAESYAERYLIKSEQGGMLIVDVAELRPATPLDQLVLELERSELGTMT